jgi:hypothetical protein
MTMRQVALPAMLLLACLGFGQPAAAAEPDVPLMRDVVKGITKPCEPKLRESLKPDMACVRYTARQLIYTKYKLQQRIRALDIGLLAVRAEDKDHSQELRERSEKIAELRALEEVVTQAAHELADLILGQTAL